jgi:hypothetical protein
MSAPDIVEFVTDPQLLGLTISPAQRTLLKAIYGVALDAAELELFRECTGRQAAPASGFGEVTVVAGARGGKDSRIAAPIVCYEATFGGHERHAAKGEQPTIVLVAQDQRATRVAFGYIRAYFERSPLLSSLLAEPPLASELGLTNGVQVVCFPCTLRSVRGFSIPVGVLDELAFFRLEGAADSDAEIQASIRRGMVAFPSTRLVKISTPYMRGGVLFDDFKAGFGVDNPDLLVWRAPSALMNPTLKAERLERERRLDPVRFSREYEGEFAEDVATFLPSAWIEAVVERGRHELAPQEGVSYIAAVDASGGGADAFALAVVHVEGAEASRRVMQDVMRSWRKPRDGATNLEGAVEEIAGIVRRYRVSAVHGDRYARGWVREAFQRHGLRYEDATVRGSYLDRSAAYLEAEPLFAQGTIAILDDAALARELRNLERRPSAGGRDRVDHPRALHDDHANALCLAAALAVGGEEDKLRLCNALTDPGISVDELQAMQDRDDARRARASTEAIEHACRRTGAWFPG